MPIDDLCAVPSQSAERSRLLMIPILLALLAAASCGFRRREVDEIPSRFRGWANIKYGAPCASRTADPYVVRIDERGHGCSALPFREGWGLPDRYYFVEGDRRTIAMYETPHEGMIWGRSTDLPRIPGRLPIDSYFVGTEQQYRQAVSGKGPYARADEPL